MKLKGKAILVIVLLSFVLVNVTGFAQYAQKETAPKSETTFLDVGSDHWAKQAITWMVERNILAGYPNHQFLPENNVSREEFAKMMVKAFNLSLIKPQKTTFVDVDKNNWAYAYVETAKSYLTGFRSTTGDYFRPQDKAVREDMAVALVKAKLLQNEAIDETVLANYIDSNTISPNLKKHVSIAIKNKIMTGYEIAGSTQMEFKAQSYLTRAEAAMLLYNSVKDEKITYDTEEKITYEETVSIEPQQEGNSPQTNTAPVVTSTREGGKLILHWNQINDKGLQGYKVVISKFDATPAYPTNGYLYWITDREKTYAVIDNHEGYKSGDFGEYLKAGSSYYFSVTAVYEDTKVPGNVLYIQY